MSSSITSIFACLALAGLMPAALAERHFSSPAPSSQKATRAPDRLSPALAPAAAFVLDALPASTIQSIRERNGRPGPAAIQVGVVRDVPMAARMRTAAPAWTQVADGHVLQWRIRATGAQALRVALDVQRASPALRARFASSADASEIFAESVPAHGVLWSPLIAGDEALVELFAPAGTPLAEIDISLARVADHFANPTQHDLLAKSQWLAATCEVDLVCESGNDPALARAGAASIKVNWVEGYSAFACSATLLNPADGSFRPYIYTAAHCLGDQAGADSMVSIWFYEKSTCGGDDARAAVQVAGGAQLLVADATLDASLLRMNRMPPAGAVYAGWDSSPPSFGESLVALHHANGEVTKVSHGTVVDPPPYPLFTLAWTSGIVQGGSSGSGAFSRVDSPQPDLLMRGGLSATNASCSAPGTGVYSRLDQAWPLVAPYLSVAPAHANATGLWWKADEPGWGLSLNQQGDIAFGVLFTYADDGRPSWLVASDMRLQDGGVFAGTLYRASANGVAGVGRMQVTLSSANAATLEYSVNGRSYAKAITREEFAGAAPVCTATKASRATATTYQDLWWDPREPGWGLGVAHQGDTLFATLFTYDDAGRDTWLVASNVNRAGDGTYSGMLYRTSAALLDQGVKSVRAAPAGSIRIAFSDGENAIATLSIDGRTSTKRIERQVFGPSAPLCR